MTSDFIKSTGALVFQYNSYDKLVEKLYLTAIVDSFKRLKLIFGINEMIENQIRNQLAFDLENHNKLLKPYFQNNILKLTKENTILLSPQNTKRTDIEFFISGYGDFVVECKRLTSANQRYISDGVERFTTEYYSKNDSEASLIGFVVQGNMTTIITHLKSIVEQHQLSPGSNHLLNENCIGYNDSFRSVHNRKTKGPILLHHLFVNLT